MTPKDQKLLIGTAIAALGAWVAMRKLAEKKAAEQAQSPAAPPATPPLVMPPLVSPSGQVYVGPIIQDQVMLTPEEVGQRRTDIQVSERMFDLLGVDWLSMAPTRRPTPQEAKEIAATIADWRVRHPAKAAELEGYLLRADKLPASTSSKPPGQLNVEPIEEGPSDETENYDDYEDAD